MTWRDVAFDEAWQRLDKAAEALFDTLREKDQRLVLAESCTGGLAAAAMTRQIGVSDVFVGSSVVYQVDTKVAWLGLDREFIETHDAVSPEVAEAMAREVMTLTPHATIAASITGHLGPGVPVEREGKAHAAVLVDGGLTHHFLRTSDDGVGDPARLRPARQIEMTCHLLSAVRERLDGV